MSGWQCIYMIRNGKFRIKLYVVVLLFAIVLGGCSGQQWLGNGRGDGHFSLSTGYQLQKVNSYDIFLVRPYQDSELNGGEILINDFSVSSYQMESNYILLRGILAKSLAEQQKKMAAKDYAYYLVDVETDSIIGPFGTFKEFAGTCEGMSITIQDLWALTNDIEWE